MITVIVPWIFLTIGGALIVNGILLAYGPVRGFPRPDTSTAGTRRSRWAWSVTFGAFLMIGGVAALFLMIGGVAALLVSLSGSP